MINYIVKYFIGSTLGELHVMAHNEKQAREIVIPQIRNRHQSRAKVEVMYVWEEGTQDPSLKELDKYKVS